MLGNEPGYPFRSSPILPLKTQTKIPDQGVFQGVVIGEDERHHHLYAISQGVTVWGAISWDTQSSLVVLQSTLTARRYVDDILTPIVLPMLSSRPGAIYQQEMLVHILRDSPNNVFKYDVLPWPARSPDLSPKSMSGRVGKATALINCADAKTMAGSSTGGHKCLKSRSRLEDLTVTLQGIPFVLEDSTGQSCGRWRRTESFLKTDPAGSWHLRSVPRGGSSINLFKRRAGRRADCV
ncbi:DDE_3 domain-containing protein [Trichonephila clavipes]|nr:DDE_3 domain-containing protein [Trichonephila clavipes]